MPRGSRLKSSTGIYHVMARGVNREAIFLDDQDRRVYLEILDRCKRESGFELYVYCLMGNHVHLLLREGEIPVAQILQRVGCGYATSFNRRHQRVGHLFQDRFKSEPVESDRYFKTVARYIHQNPVKAGLCGVPEDYAFSSYRDYLDGDCSIIDISLLLGMMDLEGFISFHAVEETSLCLDLT